MFDTVSSKVGKTIVSNRKVIETFLVVLILLQFAPYDVLGPKLNSQLQSVLRPVLNPITNIMSNVYMRLLVFVVLVYSCCIRRDMNLFFIVSIYFIVSRQ